MPHTEDDAALAWIREQDAQVQFDARFAARGLAIAEMSRELTVADDMCDTPISSITRVALEERDGVDLVELLARAVEVLTDISATIEAVTAALDSLTFYLLPAVTSVSCACLICVACRQLRTVLLHQLLAGRQPTRTREQLSDMPVPDLEQVILDAFGVTRGQVGVRDHDLAVIAARIVHRAGRARTATPHRRADCGDPDCPLRENAWHRPYPDGAAINVPGGYLQSLRREQRDEGATMLGAIPGGSWTDDLPYPGTGYPPFSLPTNLLFPT
jgi:hypothetical protein